MRHPCLDFIDTQYIQLFQKAFLFSPTENDEKGVHTMPRYSGILMHISSLPSPYGIGTLGKAAYEFADFLAKSGQHYWQLLPLGPTGYGDSPYQSFSTFAGNPYFIDLDLLIEQGLLSKADTDTVDWGTDPLQADYARLYQHRYAVLRKAWQTALQLEGDALQKKLRAFSEQNPWLANYALFMAVKQHFDNKCWLEWPDDAIRLHLPQAVAQYTALLQEDIAFICYQQYLFYSQWTDLRSYVHRLGLEIIGDLPIYVAMDSADVWSEPQFFQLEQDRTPRCVAGVPPDYFSKDGQLWGNPLYDWDVMAQDGYGWWIRRVEGAQKLYDVLRIDHFRGLVSYWSIPYGEKTAKNGKWCKGPGIAFVQMLTGWFYGIRLIAEDLGILTPEVKQLLQDSGLPGMKVLEFAFDPSGESDYLPHNQIKNCVCYIGTHDNETLSRWLQTAPEEELAFARAYLGLNAAEGFAAGMLRAGLSGVADTFILQMQDVPGIDAEVRMNTPGTLGGNWTWRLCKNALTPAISASLAELTRRYGRFSCNVDEKGRFSSQKALEKIDKSNL